MKKLRWQLIIILVTGLVVGVLLISQQPIVKPITPEPAKGGVYSEALVGSLVRLNPLLDTYNSPDRDIDRLLYSGLIRFDSNGLPQGDLAASWGVSKDGTIYNIALRPNIKWQDGTPFTSADVLFTIDLMRSDSSPLPQDLRAFWKDVEVKNYDDTTLQFKLPEAFAPFLDYLTFGILPKHLLQNQSMDQLVNDQFNLQPVGTGPYRLDHLIVKDNKPTGVVLTAYDGYYGQKPFIQQLIFNYYPDSAAALQAYRQGDVEGIGNVTADILGDVLAEPNLSIYTGREPRLTLVYFNLNDQDVPFLQDASLRQALLTGLNRQRMVDHILHGQAIVADGPVLPDTWAYYDGLEPVTYDVQSAQKTLKDAGYTLSADGQTLTSKDGVAVAFSLIYPDDDVHKALAESIQSNWAALGVKVSLEALPYDQLVNDHLSQRKYQAALVDINLSRSPDPDPYPFWDQAQITGGQNYAQWNDQTASEYLEQARASTDISERERLYRNFQVIFAKELPALPLYYPVYTYAVDRQIQGVQMGPLFDTSDRFANIANWYLVANRTTQSQETPTTQP